MHIVYFSSRIREIVQAVTVSIYLYNARTISLSSVTRFYCSAKQAIPLQACCSCQFITCSRLIVAFALISATSPIHLIASRVCCGKNPNLSHIHFTNSSSVSIASDGSLFLISAITSFVAFSKFTQKFFSFFANSLSSCSSFFILNHPRLFFLFKSQRTRRKINLLNLLELEKVEVITSLIYLGLSLYIVMYTSAHMFSASGNFRNQTKSNHIDCAFSSNIISRLPHPLQMSSDIGFCAIYLLRYFFLLEAPPIQIEYLSLHRSKNHFANFLLWFCFLHCLFLVDERR